MNKLPLENSNKGSDIFIGQLFHEVNERDLKAFFNFNNTKVRYLKLVKDECKRSKCVAFGNCPTENELIKALKLSNLSIKGKNIIIERASKK